MYTTLFLREQEPLNPLSIGSNGFLYDIRCQIQDILPLCNIRKKSIFYILLNGDKMRNKILYYALKYNGNYDKIFKALKTNEKYSIIKTDLSYITIIDKEYPKKLLYLKKPPLILFYKGNIKLLEKEAVSIVGSRNAKSYGIKYTKILSKQLAKDYPSLTPHIITNH